MWGIIHINNYQYSHKAVLIIDFAQGVMQPEILKAELSCCKQYTKFIMSPLSNYHSESVLQGSCSDESPPPHHHHTDLSSTGPPHIQLHSLKRTCHHYLLHTQGKAGENK